MARQPPRPGTPVRIAQAVHRAAHHSPQRRRGDGRQAVHRPVRWGAANPGPAHFAELQRAVFEQRCVVLTYEQRDSDEAFHIAVDPYGLVSKSGAWYLVADVEGSPRMFRADRLHSVEILAKPARLRPGIVLRDLWSELLAQFEQRIRSLEIVIRLDRAEYGLFLRVHGKTV